MYRILLVQIKRFRPVRTGKGKAKSSFSLLTTSRSAATIIPGSLLKVLTIHIVYIYRRYRFSVARRLPIISSEVQKEKRDTTVPSVMQSYEFAV